VSIPAGFGAELRPQRPFCNVLKGAGKASSVFLNGGRGRGSRRPLISATVPMYSMQMTCQSTVQHARNKKEFAHENCSTSKSLSFTHKAV